MLNQSLEHILLVDELRIEVIVLGEEIPRSGEELQSPGGVSSEIISQIFIFCRFYSRQEGSDVVHHLKMLNCCGFELWRYGKSENGTGTHKMKSNNSHAVSLCCSAVALKKTSGRAGLTATSFTVYKSRLKHF